MHVRWVLVVLLVSLHLNPRCLSQNNAGSRSIYATRAESVPVVDGRLDDTVWSQADWQSRFLQLVPVPGQPARAETRVAVAYDDGNIYIAFRCESPAGPATNSKITRRDGDIDQDNAVTVFLDTFHNRRDSYYFSTNSLGVRVDGTIGDDGVSNSRNWDCAWQVAAQEDPHGWSAEMAIPVSELRIPGETVPAWGINFRRNYPEYFEISYWSERDSAWRVSQSGDLTGMPRFQKGFGASLYPYIVGLQTNGDAPGHRALYSSGGTEIRAGADLSLRLGASANANVTVNPDFATVEADQDVINLTRYETFYPEKRLYFLEGAELLNKSSVFYSRRIGEIDWGVKANGRAGPMNYAALTVREPAMEPEGAAQTSVMRLRRDILGRSTLGVMAVGRAADGFQTRVLNADLSLNFASGVRLKTDFTGSFPTGGQFRKSALIRLEQSKELYNASVYFQSIDPGFKDDANPVAYIQDDNRREIYGQLAGVKWIKRGGLEKIQGHLMNKAFWGFDGTLRDLELTQWGAVTFFTKWLIGAGNTFQTEQYERKYDNGHWLIEGGYNQQSWNNTSWIIQGGRNFDRDFNQYIFRQRLKPIPELSLTYSLNRLTFSPDPDRSSTWLHVLTGDWNFTPDLWIRLFSQYRSENHRMYIYGLFGWRFAPPFGALYLAYTGDRQDVVVTPLELSDPLRRDDRTFFVKLTVPVELVR